MQPERRPVDMGLAPAWAEASAPRHVLRRLSPALLIIAMPEQEGEWRVATSEETDAVANRSYLGNLLRPYCALMALPYSSNN